ncbi:hypothetical protein CR513_13341, partial [Mucuna pruriens]
MPGKVIPHPRRRRFSDGLLLLTVVMSEERHLLLLLLRHRHRGRLHHHFGSRGGEAPNLTEIGPGWKGPQAGRGRGAHERGTQGNSLVLGRVFVGAYALAEDEGRGGDEGDGGEGGGGGASAGGSDDGGLGLAKEPLDGLTVGLVTQLPRELENTGGAYDGHPYTAAASVDLAVTVLRGGLLDRHGLAND